MKIELKQINVNMAEQEYEMLQGILDIENGFTNPAYNLSYKAYKNWLYEVDNHSRGVGLQRIGYHIRHMFCMLIMFP